MTTHAPTSAPSVAVIGAGIAGLTAARALHDAGHTVRVFEKARGVGGRMSTRRRDGLTFDHGAQYFTARSDAFQREVAAWIDAGVVASWDGRIVDLEGGAALPRMARHARYVAVPRMNMICKHLAAPLDVSVGERVASMAAEGTRWRLFAETSGDLGTYDVVLCSVPPAQAEPLMAVVPTLGSLAERARMEPCWALMLTFEERLEVPYDAAFVYDGALSWIAREGSKPGRPVPSGGDVWLAHASPRWSTEHANREATEVAVALRHAFDRATRTSATPTLSMAHRWLYARCTTALGTDSAWDPGRRVGLCGDWLRGSTVEDAWRSGAALAAEVHASLGEASPGPSGRAIQRA